MPNTMKTPMTVKQASEFTGYSQSHLRHLAKVGTIPAYKTGEGKSNKIIFSKEELAEYLFSRPVRCEENIAEEILNK